MVLQNEHCILCIATLHYRKTIRLCTILFLHTHTHAHTHNSYTYTHTLTHTHTHAHTHTQTCSHTNTHTHAHTQTQTHTHTHTHIHTHTHPSLMVSFLYHVCLFNTRSIISKCFLVYVHWGCTHPSSHRQTPRLPILITTTNKL